MLVLDPVDAASAASIVAQAKQQNVPVISYDRLVTNADIDYYVSFDNVRVGQLQAQSLVKKLKADGKGNGTIVMINGAPTDSNAAQFKQGANSVFNEERPEDRQGVRHPGLEPRPGPDRDAAGDHRARQRRASPASTWPTTEWRAA